MSEVPQALLFMGIIPALFLMFISLKGYDNYYKEKLIFLTFVIGIVLGVIVVLIESYSAVVGIYFVILYPILEQLSKTIILNFKRFHGKKETPIYGLSLGLGYGSIFLPSSLIFLNLRGIDNNLSTAVVLVGALGIILIHAATGVCIGYGVFKHSLLKYLTFSILLYLPVTVLSFFSSMINYNLQLAILPYGLVLYWYFTTRIMVKIKDQKGRKKSEN